MADLQSSQLAVLDEFTLFMSQCSNAKKMLSMPLYTVLLQNVPNIYSGINHHIIFNNVKDICYFNVYRPPEANVSTGVFYIRISNM